MATPRRGKKTKPTVISKAWAELQELVRDADEATCQKLLKEELAGKKRRQFVLRIHSRLNRVRADAEREKLMKAAPKQ